VGPPRAATTSIGAELTLTFAPRAAWTGDPDAARDTAVQKSNPGNAPSDPFSAGRTGSRNHEATVRQAADPMTAMSNSFSDVDTR
jgi:hypothetical protein